jgi:hypothetical protein
LTRCKRYRPVRCRRLWPRLATKRPRSASEPRERRDLHKAFQGRRVERVRR